MVRIGITGICGKMGKRIASLTVKDKDLELAAGLEIEGSDCIGKDLGELFGSSKGVKISSSLEEVISDIDCLIDFTFAEPTLKNLEVCKKGGVAIVIGTTGIDAAGEEKIKEASSTIPVVYSPNMAPGVNLLFKIVSEAAKALVPDFTVKVDETHHVHKKDSPSGTAKKIAQVIKEASEVDPPVEAFREGEVIGNHGIVFESEFETLEIRHDAKTRDVFASGALKAAIFLKDKEKGLYNMADVLNIT